MIETTISNTIVITTNVEAQSILNDLVSIVDNSYDYYGIASQLPILAQRAQMNLTGIDQSAVLVAIEVAMNSAYMWLPISEGGQGYYDLVNPETGGEGWQWPSSVNSSSVNKNSAEIKQKSSVWPSRKRVENVIMADAIGAFSGFLQAAMPYFVTGGPANPISNALLFGRTLTGGISASAIAGLRRG